MLVTDRSSAAEMNPFPSLSNTRNASRISSSLSVSFILRAIIVRNSGKSIVPLPKDKQGLASLAGDARVLYHPHRLRWSCLVILPRLDSGPNCAWPCLEKRSLSSLAAERGVFPPNSFVVIVPSPSLSKRENASLNSAICSSVNWSAIASRLELLDTCLQEENRSTKWRGKESSNGKTITIITTTTTFTWQHSLKQNNRKRLRAGT